MENLIILKLVKSPFLLNMKCITLVYYFEPIKCILDMEDSKANNREGKLAFLFVPPRCYVCPCVSLPPCFPCFAPVFPCFPCFTDGPRILPSTVTAPDFPTLLQLQNFLHCYIYKLPYIVTMTDSPTSNIRHKDFRSSRLLPLLRHGQTTPPLF